MGRRLGMIVLAAALASAPIARAQALALADVLARLRAYSAAYGEQYSATVATERYKQTSGRSTFLYRETLLESDFGIVRVPGEDRWYGFRDVYRVDGKVVQDRGDRLGRLFSEAFDTSRQQAKKIAEESTRFNIGPVLRTINNPALVLEILNPANDFRLSFSKADEDVQDGTRLWVIQFKENYFPTLVQTSEGGDEPSEGRIWVDPLLGRLHRADVSFRSLDVRRRSFRARLSVIFREDTKLGMWVPSKMTERYDGSDIEEVTGDATYTDYRRFGVETREDFR